MLAEGKLPACLAVDSKYAYWGDYQDTEVILRVPLVGGTPEVIAQGNFGECSDLTVDALGVYWTSVNPDAVNMVPLGGGSVVTLADDKNDVYKPSYIAVDASAIYWISQVETSTGVYRLSRSPGSFPKELYHSYDADSNGLAVVGGNVYWSKLGSSLGNTQGCIFAVPSAGGTPTTFATGKWSAGGLIVHNSTAFWLSGLWDSAAPDPYQIVSTPLAGGPITRHVKSPDLPYAFAVDDSWVYWINGLTKSLAKTPLGGGKPIELLPDVETYRLALGDKRLYWFSDDNKLMSLPK